MIETSVVCNLVLLFDILLGEYTTARILEWNELRSKYVCSRSTPSVSIFKQIDEPNAAIGTAPGEKHI